MSAGSGRHIVMTHYFDKSVQLTIEMMERHGAAEKKRMLMAAPRLDPIDLRILEAIQKDGRIAKLALAEKVGLSPTACWVRLRRLEAAGIISGYHARIALRAIAPIATSITAKLSATT